MKDWGYMVKFFVDRRFIFYTESVSDFCCNGCVRYVSKKMNGEIVLSEIFFTVLSSVKYTEFTKQLKRIVAACPKKMHLKNCKTYRKTYPLKNAKNMADIWKRTTKNHFTNFLICDLKYLTV